MFLSGKYSGRSINFPPAQSTFEISLTKASSDQAGGVATYFATSLLHFWCVTEVCSPGTRHPISFANYMIDTL